MAGAERIRAAIDAMMQLPSTKGMALDRAGARGALARPARCGRARARLQGYRAGLEEGARREAVR